MIIGVTGHRPQLIGGFNKSTWDCLLATAGEMLRNQKPNLVLTGMAQGWDMAVASACAEMQIPFIALVPYIGYKTKWTSKASQYQEKMLKAAQRVIVVSIVYEGDREAAMRAYLTRDKAIVDHCDYMVALLNRELPHSGTLTTAKYAESKGIPVSNYWHFYNRLREGSWTNPHVA